MKIDATHQSSLVYETTWHDQGLPFGICFEEDLFHEAILQWSINRNQKHRLIMLGEAQCHLALRLLHESNSASLVRWFYLSKNVESEQALIQKVFPLSAFF